MDTKRVDEMKDEIKRLWREMDDLIADVKTLRSDPTVDPRAVEAKTKVAIQHLQVLHDKVECMGIEIASSGD